MSGGMSGKSIRLNQLGVALDAVDCLEKLEVPLTETNVEHMELLLIVMKLYAQKNKVHNDTWKQYGWRDSLMHMRSKLTRTEHQWSNGGNDDYDDPLDLINYTLFFIRNALDDNRNGTLFTNEFANTAELLTQIALRKDDPAFRAAIMEALR